MKRITTTLTILSLAFSMQSHGQGFSPFNTIGMERKKDNCKKRQEMKLLPAESDLPLDSLTGSSEETQRDVPNALSADIFNAHAEDSGRQRKDGCKNKNYNGNIISYYEGRPRELNLGNLMEVANEVGLSNHLFVLAQALLETGNFSSRVCKEYNNLFGLYDSKHLDYFRFARWEDSVVGYKKMIQYKYKGGNYLHFLRRIGYAEDVNYIYKIARMAKQIYHTLFDA